MAKAIGSDIVAFFASEWPEDWYVDDGTLTAFDGDIVENENEKVHLPLSDKYDLSDFGFLCGAGSLSLSAFFNRWKKEQTMETRVVEFPKDRAGFVLANLATLGVKVL